MELLVLGANGLLGSNIVYAGRERGWTISGTYHSTSPDFNIPLVELDITDSTQVVEVIEAHDPDWVVNCAAMTDVDSCEADPNRAYAVNAEAPRELASHCADTGREFLHLSTDYVFDGETTDRYTEEAQPNPVQVYGASKLAGEQAVRDAMDAALVARLSFVYGVHRGTNELTGFPSWIRGQLRSGEEMPLFTDQHVTPSRAGQTAATLCSLIEANARELFNVACQSCVSPYEFGEAVCREMGSDRSLLVEGTLSEVDRPASRPRHTCLDVTKLEDRLGKMQPTLVEDLAAISEWLEEDYSS